MIQTLQKKGIVFNSCTRCLVLMQHCPHARPVEITNRPTRNTKDDESNRHLGIQTFYPELSALAEEPTEEQVLLQVLDQQLKVVDEVQQDVVGQEGPMDPNPENHIELDEVLGGDPVVDNPQTREETQDTFVFQDPQSEGTLNNAPHSDSDSGEPPEPNIVWSCQAMRWEDDRDLHGPRR